MILILNKPLLLLPLNISFEQEDQYKKAKKMEGLQDGIKTIEYEKVHRKGRFFAFFKNYVNEIGNIHS